VVTVEGKVFIWESYLLYKGVQYVNKFTETVINTVEYCKY